MRFEEKTLAETAFSLAAQKRAREGKLTLVLRRP